MGSGTAEHVAQVLNQYWAVHECKPPNPYEHSYGDFWICKCGKQWAIGRIQFNGQPDTLFWNEPVVNTIGKAR